ncbi:hypothetical protein MGG_18033 [Pyricularia oryzae 70-15]|uniref:Uncharacterized protein n=3 Tax=Pyricularia oryzae TaxID=318829 RepID=G5EHT8_PYRO7|nr:uncharacterized protein MGG_18033 [Pyricularia oryzae 70-15]EAQ70838.1 hypothetical protein MGCH7_ch7g245 [Pyricularia oryzae 70-15]EHA46527.1 hypothetical protein MGG_18033 [Pyricularia oryzae 70-15]ELQ34252.1 hypothetical protein OOU_Y34scaffold00777g10 [Pyricularia oryzae Y34]
MENWVQLLPSRQYTSLWIVKWASGLHPHGIIALNSRDSNGWHYCQEPSNSRRN